MAHFSTAKFHDDVNHDLNLTQRRTTKLSEAEDHEEEPRPSENVIISNGNLKTISPGAVGESNSSADEELTELTDYTDEFPMSSTKSTLCSDKKHKFFVVNTITFDPLRFFFDIGFFFTKVCDYLDIQHPFFRVTIPRYYNNFLKLMKGVLSGDEDKIQFLLFSIKKFVRKCCGLFCLIAGLFFLLCAVHKEFRENFESNVSDMLEVAAEEAAEAARQTNLEKYNIKIPERESLASTETTYNILLEHPHASAAVLSEAVSESAFCNTYFCCCGFLMRKMLDHVVAVGVENMEQAKDNQDSKGSFLNSANEKVSNEIMVNTSSNAAKDDEVKISVVEVHANGEITNKTTTSGLKSAPPAAAIEV